MDKNGTQIWFYNMLYDNSLEVPKGVKTNTDKEDIKYPGTDALINKLKEKQYEIDSIKDTYWGVTKEKKKIYVLIRYNNNEKHKSFGGVGDIEEGTLILGIKKNGNNQYTLMKEVFNDSFKNGSFYPNGFHGSKSWNGQNFVADKFTADDINAKVMEYIDGAM